MKEKYDMESVFADFLEKTAVEEVKPDDIAYQLSSIMGGKKKYSSVAQAVEEMKARSGLTKYLDQVKTSVSKSRTKIASTEELPIIIKNNPGIETTIANYIESTNGNMSIMGIIERIKQIHRNDVSDPKEWNDEKLFRMISKMNMQEKSKTYNEEQYHNLGKEEKMSDQDFDPSNSDPFSGLTPVKS